MYNFWLKKISIPLYRLFVIVPLQKKMKKATYKEYNELQLAIKSGDIEKIKKAGTKWNLSLLKFRQQHLGLSV